MKKLLSMITILAVAATTFATTIASAAFSPVAPTFELEIGDCVKSADEYGDLYTTEVTLKYNTTAELAPYTSVGRPPNATITCAGVSNYNFTAALSDHDSNNMGFYGANAKPHQGEAKASDSVVWAAGVPGVDYLQDTEKEIATFYVVAYLPECSATFDFTTAAFGYGEYVDNSPVMHGFNSALGNLTAPSIYIPSYNETQTPVATVDSIAFDTAATATVEPGTVVDLAATVTGTGDYDDTYSVTLNGDVYADATWTAPAATEEVQTFTFVATATGNADATATVVYTIDALPAFVNATASIEGANSLIPNSIYYTVEIDANDEEIVAPSIGITDDIKDKTIKLGNVTINGSLDFYIAIGGVTSGTTYTATLNSTLASIDGVNGSVTAE